MVRHGLIALQIHSYVETTAEIKNHQGIFNLKEHCDGELIASEFQSLQIHDRTEIPFLNKNIKKILPICVV